MLFVNYCIIFFHMNNCNPTFTPSYVFRNWYTDEPSCGSEKCVVMYHQPTANPGLGGPYLYQWNDDRCNMKHNYICKYEPGRMDCKLA